MNRYVSLALLNGRSVAELEGSASRLVSRHPLVVMRKVIIPVACLAFGTAGIKCAGAESHVGNWKNTDGDSFFRLELKQDGSCFAVAGGKVDAIGGQCKYTVSGSNINIVAFEESGKLEEVPSSQSLQFKYDGSSDSLSSVSDNPMRLSRMPWRRDD